MNITQEQQEKYRAYTFAFFKIQQLLKEIITAKQKIKEDTSTEQNKLKNMYYLDLFTFTKLNENEQNNIFDNL